MKSGVKNLKKFNSKLTFGHQTADPLTKWAGSWTFIISFIFYWFFGYF